MIVKSPHPGVDIPNMSAPEFILGTFDRFPDKAAMIDGITGREFTFRDLGFRIRAFAAGMQARGLKKGDIVAVFSPNVPDYAVIFHGVALAGGATTTVNPLYTPRELRQQINDAGATTLFCHALVYETAKEAVQDSAVNDLFVIGEVDGETSIDSLLGDPDDLQAVEISPGEDLVVIPYSSGTTGLPKGVMLTHRNIVANLCQLAGLETTTILAETDVTVGVLPFFHIYGMVAIMNYGLMVGATIITVPRFDLEQYLSLIQDRKVTRINVVPPIVVALAKHPLVDAYDLSSLDGIFCGAAPLGEDLAREVTARLGCDILQAYGLTETSPATHCSPNHPDAPSSIGPPIPNTEVRIVNVDTGEVLGTGEHGELHVRGPQVMAGYLNNSEATDATIDTDGWLKTGDLGYFDDEKRFYIVDRVKELIKYNAYQVAPAELEGLLLGHPAVADVAVIPVPDERAGQIPKAYIVRNGEAIDQELMDWLAERVSPQKRVRQVEFTEAIPKSASGKILRRELIERERARVNAEAGVSD